MGGTIAKLSQMGYNVKLVIAVLPNFTKNDKKEERKLEAINSSKVWDVLSQIFLTYLPMK